MEWLGIIGSLAAVFTVIGAIFNFSVIRPLNESIHSLSCVIKTMQQALRDIDEKRQEAAERLAKVESSTASAHHRIDTLEGRINHDV